MNLENNDDKCFLWCHIRHLNPLKIYPEILTKPDKKCQWSWLCTY